MMPSDLRMNRIDRKFRELREKGRKAFIAYLTVGFPDLDTNLRFILEMEKRGVDLVELGLPFSDPIADGPTIQASSQAALNRGFRFQDAIRLASRVRERSAIPLILMGYLNPFLSFPAEKLARETSTAGIDAVIIPDLPPEESGTLREALAGRGVHTIFLLAPTSPPERMGLAARLSRGFIYYVSRTGVTGEQKDLSEEIRGKIIQIRRVSDLPVCVGFGISTRGQLRRIWQAADGAIVGSALIRPFLKSRSPRDGLKKALTILDELLAGRF